MPVANSYARRKIGNGLGLFCSPEIGQLHQIYGIMDGSAFLRIVRDIRLSSAIALLGYGCLYQQKNDPKH